MWQGFRYQGGSPGKAGWIRCPIALYAPEQPGSLRDGVEFRGKWLIPDIPYPISRFICTKHGHYIAIGAVDRTDFTSQMV
jgi:hypothetical protein